MATFIYLDPFFVNFYKETFSVQKLHSHELSLCASKIGGTQTRFMHLCSNGDLAVRRSGQLQQAQ